MAALAVLLAVVLGGVAGRTAGVAAVVLSALVGLVSPPVLDVALKRRAQNAARAKRRQELLKAFAFPAPADDGGPSGDHTCEKARPDVARYLRPEEAVVGFQDRPELAELLGWCASSAHAAVRLVTGSGGAGKTRLALRLGQDLAAHGWLPLWVPRGLEVEAAAAVRELGQRCVLVVDYAETRDGLGALLAEVAGWEGPGPRILLLARGSGEWWQRLAAEADERVTRLLGTAPVTLGPLSSPGGQAEVFSEALTSFAARLGVSRPDATLALQGPEPVVLVVHAAALLAVLDHESGSSPARSAGQVLDGLLGHEARYWARSASARGLALDPAIQRRAVTVGCLVGADGEAAAARLLASIPDLADSGDLRGRTARWLHDLYPEARGGDAGPGEWIGPLRPNLVAERLVVRELSAHQDLIPVLFTGLQQNRVTRALTVLARAALTQPGALQLLRDALAANVAQLAVPAMSVALETNPAIGELVAEALDARPVPVPVMEQIADTAPYPSFALAPVAAVVFAQLADQASDPARKAGWLVSLCMRLHELGRRGEALAVIDEAVAVYRDLAEGRPSAFLPSLAVSLNNKSAQLSGLGRREEALAVIDEAVAVYRDLARDQPDAFLPDLAMTLNNQSVHLGDLGRSEEALAVIDEAVKVYRDLAGARPGAFLRGFASSLNNLSAGLAELERPEEALAVIDEAVAVYRDLARDQPDAFLPGLAMTLSNQSSRLADLGRQAEALAVGEEAIAVYRDLAGARPSAFLHNLAISLNNQSTQLSGLGRREAALAVINEAVTICRGLSDAQPDAFLPDLAMTLNNQSNCLGELGRREEALAVINEAVTIRRGLSDAQPEAFLPDLATSLHNQSDCLGELGRREEALAVINEAITIRRGLAHHRPTVFDSPLSRSLDRLSGLLSALGRNIQADAARTEAGSLRQTTPPGASTRPTGE